MEIPTNYELNSFLTTLMEQWNESAAQAVINAFHTLPFASDYIQIKRKTTHDASVAGHTDEIGDVAIHGKEVKETIRGEEYVARVGYYKVERREYDKKAFVITWRHFLGFDYSARSFSEAPGPIFGVVYGKETREPFALVRWDFFEQKGIAGLPWLVILKEVASFLHQTFLGRLY